MNDGGKRPVMVWLHGGGFTAGSGQEQPAYHGENLSRRGDVVVVSVNHRLGVLGYLNLSAWGSEYASSANAGMLDLVLALEWVRDNIERFGGDPGNVLIFGQSGGGSKVSTLMAMPSAKGLFHKAVVQSGSGLRMSEPADSERMAAAVMAQLGLSKPDVRQLHDLPVSRLISAMVAAGATFPSRPPGAGAMAGYPTWGPTVDGRVLPTHPFHPAAPELSRNVPMLIGTVLNETSPSQNDPEAERLSEAEMREHLSRQFGAKTDRVLAAARALHPAAAPVELLSIIRRPRTNAILQAERKVAQGGAPAYMYLFRWKTPLLDGRPRAFHCSEIPFVFDNTDVSAFATGGGAGPRALAAKVSEAWIRFARTGNPNHPGLPAWPTFSAPRGPVMVFDTQCQVADDPDRTLRTLVTEA
jgi:para-nitrobenzyl esterase